jgi:tetratricopeptide (TPR) repeat protein
MTDPKTAGLQLFHQGRYEDALPLLEQALQLAPNDGYLHLCAGIAYASRHQQSQAEAHLSKAIWLRPNDALAQYNWACLLHQQGRHAEALTAYDTAARLEPSLIAAKTAADSLRRSMGQPMTGHYGQTAQPYSTAPYNPHPIYARRNDGRIYNWIGLLCALIGICVCPFLFGLASVVFGVIGATRGDKVFGIIVIICGIASIFGGICLGLAVQSFIFNSTMPSLQ